MGTTCAESIEERLCTEVSAWCKLAGGELVREKTCVRCIFGHVEIAIFDDRFRVDGDSGYNSSGKIVDWGVEDTFFRIEFEDGVVVIGEGGEVSVSQYRR